MTLSPRVLATRCPHCHTVFRVVADQLKLRDGLVRCGHCREVFDGRAYLCEPPRDDEAPQAATESVPEMHTSPVASPVASAPAPVVSEHADTANPSLSDSDSEASAARTTVPEMLTPTAIAALLGTPDESRAQMQHGPGRYIDDDPTVLPAPTAVPASAKLAGASAIAPTEKPPGAARVIWRVLITLAVIGLLAQWAWIERAALVDRIPALRDAFATVGRPLHIAIAPARQPDMLQLSSVTLVTDDGSATGTTDSNAAASAATAATIAAASDASADAAVPADSVPMTLTVFMRNDAGHAVAWPSLELTLSDIDGKPVVRRVFAAGDYVADGALRDAGLAPHNERTIRLRLSAQAALASNYRVLAFYP
ncbi:DUF3426 domain-containing protein [Pandoraea norimbergensis]|uniref:Zinc finger/thioredoxin putative domain-containing protein n=1 Tax=Pandoraea norimbergensis TaxID=93219 RepID=A0ABM5WG31_9BURK|nr:DUF3426 domain-containing protein [Pandoraea norimbergensis]ALS59217.1 hypothetical protein AT302_05040 [Pandoraea norimbergensis]